MALKACDGMRFMKICQRYHKQKGNAFKQTECDRLKDMENLKGISQKWKQKSKINKYNVKKKQIKEENVRNAWSMIGKYFA